MRRIFIADTDAEARTIARTAHRKWYDSITKLWHHRQDNSVDELFEWDSGLKAETLLIGSPARVREQVTRLVAESRFMEGKPAYADAREPVLAWYQQVLRANWASPAELKREIGNASILKDGRTVLNIAGNKYRIVVWINYPYRVTYVRFIGTHEQYDRIDAQTI